MAEGSSNTRLATSRGTKRGQPPVLSSCDNSTAEDKDSDFLCPVCLDLPSEAHVTKCGHTFCRECLVRSVEANRRCPQCHASIENIDQVFPNHAVNQQVLRQRRAAELRSAFGRRHPAAAISELRDFLSFDSSQLTVSEISRMIEMLREKRERIEASTTLVKFELMKDFLAELRRHKEYQMTSVGRELQLISHDLASVQCNLDQSVPNHESASFVPLGCATTASTDALMPDYLENDCSGGSHDDDVKVGIVSGGKRSPGEEGFNVPLYSYHSTAVPPHSASLEAKRKRMRLHFDELAERYFSVRVAGFSDSGPGEGGDGVDGGSPKSSGGLQAFGECLSRFTQYSSLRPLATINYACDVVHASSNIASSIEFDKDSEFFAVAGLTKKIRIFDYGGVVADAVDLHYPVAEMVCASKISCVSWSSYRKPLLASSDYDGTVSVWDAFAGRRLHLFQEHEKRCWSVDFNKLDTKLVASGSDDHRVKLWSLDSDRSVTSLEAKANVCCVQFNPSSRYHLAFGSADHCVHYYDLRRLTEPLRVFRGHRKAVSYVKFISGDDLVSASTDSALKVWNVNSPHAVRSLQGHTNEKNFVGLATDGEYVACGSENNALYVYYRGLSKQLFSFKFQPRRFALDAVEPKEEETADFVSAVCWRRGSNIIAAGNSQGIIKVLQMV